MASAVEQFARLLILKATIAMLARHQQPRRLKLYTEQTNGAFPQRLIRFFCIPSARAQTLGLTSILGNDARSDSSLITPSPILLPKLSVTLPGPKEPSIAFLKGLGLSSPVGLVPCFLALDLELVGVFQC